tara:strand:+ start:2128 stop:2751 length:624 start_codon:yes stop_codon:yes gene_type:complete
MTALDNVEGFTSDPQGVGNDYLARVFVLAGKVASQDMAKGIFSSVRVQATGDSVIFTGCDTYRLVEITVDMPQVGEWLVFPNGKELAKASSMVKGQSHVIFMANGDLITVSSNKGSVNVAGFDPHTSYANVALLFDYAKYPDKWPVAGIGYNGDLLGETLSLMSDLVGSKRKGSDPGKVTIDRLLPHVSLTAECEGISVRAILMPMK